MPPQRHHIEQRGPAPAGRRQPAANLRPHVRQGPSAAPGRWLTRSEAYDRLVAHSQDGTLTGLRDELVLRLGLTGLRASEIAGLTVRSVANLPAITWTGKGHKPRKATAGAALSEAIRRYLDAYTDPQLDDPLIVRQVLGSRRQGGPGRLDWHRPLHSRAVFDIVSHHAAAAGLGHVAPHDLRRTAAGILHTATTDDGAHHFDLLDIQRVLGHADPATTMRSYLEPMDTEVLTEEGRGDVNASAPCDS